MTFQRNKVPDVFEQYETLPTQYYDDARWLEVRALRDAGEHLKANGLVLSIRESYGFEG